MYVEALNARRQEKESLENKTLDELDELEDELEDERVILEYRLDDRASEEKKGRSELLIHIPQEKATTRNASCGTKRQVRRSDTDIQA